MKRFINLVAVQMDILPLQNQKNVEKALRFMQEAIDTHGEVDLFVIPEDFITGPIPHHRSTHCLSNDSDEVKVFQEFAKKNKSHIVLGSFIKNIGGKFYNTTLILDDSGEIILEHHKTKLSVGERWYMSPGEKLSVAKTSIGTLGVLNCWELADPLIARNLAKQEVDIFCCPSYWTTGDLPKVAKDLNIHLDEDFINSTISPLPFQFAAAVVYANVAGDAEIHLKTKPLKLIGAGQSQICVPILGRVAHMPELKKEGFLFYKYDRNLAKISEQVSKVREDILKETN